MSKIAEHKALKAYPMDEYEFDKAKKSNIERRRFAYIQGYDQAMQDFLEKAEKWLEPTFKNLAGYNSGGDLINDFINYMMAIEDADALITKLKEKEN